MYTAETVLTGDVRRNIERSFSFFTREIRCIRRISDIDFLSATVRFKDRCRLNINITMGRKEDAPLFPNGKPDKLTFESERKKRNAGICAILASLEKKNTEEE